jgi:hypothetical protein
MSETTNTERSREDDRLAERGDTAEPDAPATVEENEGMSTVLSADTADGVQHDDD